MSKPENIPAFPNTGNSNWNLHPAEGMTLRDWFAGQAIGAVIRQCAGDAALGHPEGVKTMEQLFAQNAYAIADALLAERAKGGAL